MSNWYGVRTIYRVEPTGRPAGTDKAYSAAVTLVEERVVILEARGFDDAIRRGEAEARKYARGWRRRNPYGQQVRARYLGQCDAYVLDGPPMDRAEVFSITEVIARRLSDRSVLRRPIGREESRAAVQSRRNILDIVFATPAPGVALTRAEKAFVAHAVPPRDRRTPARRARPEARQKKKRRP